MDQPVRRRTFLGALGTAGLLCTVDLPSAAVAAPPALRPYLVEGSDAGVALPPGPGADLLLHVARRFHYEVEALRPGDAVSEAGGSTLILAPARFPAGLRGGLFPAQEATVRDILADCDGLVRWGGDHRSRPQEGLFALVARPGRAVPADAGRMPDVYAPARRRAALKLAARQGAAGGKE